jgi:hypothetical protein
MVASKGCGADIDGRFLASRLYGQIRGGCGLVGSFFDRVEVYALRKTENGVPSVHPAP